MSTTTDTRHSVPVGKWALDPVHSTIGFDVAYLAGTFRGEFHEVGARVAGGESPAVAGSARVASVDVKDENLSAHLQSPDFFDAERYPELSFESSEIERDENRITVRGNITIKGVERPVELTGTIGEPMADPYGGERFGLKLETTIDRTEFGVNWNNPLPDGTPSLANEVKLTADLQFVKEA